MAKFKIAQNPTFTIDVSIPRVGGDPITVPFTYRTQSRKELAAMYDNWSEAAKASGLAEQDELTFSLLADADMESQKQQVKDIVVKWGFEDEFNDENILALCNTCTHAATAIVEAYHLAYAEQRTKN